MTHHNIKTICKPKLTGLWDVEDDETEPDCPYCYAEDLPAEYQGAPGSNFKCKTKRGNVECELECDYPGFKRHAPADRKTVICNEDTNNWSLTGSTIENNICDAPCKAETNRLLYNLDNGDQLVVPGASQHCQVFGTTMKCFWTCDQAEEAVVFNTCKTHGAKKDEWKWPNKPTDIKKEYKAGTWATETNSVANSGLCEWEHHENCNYDGLVAQILADYDENDKVRQLVTASNARDFAKWAVGGGWDKKWIRWRIDQDSIGTECSSLDVLCSKNSGKWGFDQQDKWSKYFIFDEPCNYA